MKPWHETPSAVFLHGSGGLGSVLQGRCLRSAFAQDEESKPSPRGHPTNATAPRGLPRAVAETGDNGAARFFPRDARLNGCFRVHCFGARLAPVPWHRQMLSGPRSQLYKACWHSPRIGSRPKRRLFRRWRRRLELAHGAVGVNGRYWLAGFNLVLITRSGVPPWARRLPRAKRGSPMPAALP